MLQTFLKYFPDIIKSAATSRLGIVALIVLVLAGMGVYLFRTAPIKARLTVFTMLFGGFLALATLALVNTTTEIRNQLHPDGNTNQVFHPDDNIDQRSKLQIALKSEIKRRVNEAQALISDLAEHTNHVLVALASERPGEWHKLHRSCERVIAQLPDLWSGSQEMDITRQQLQLTNCSLDKLVDVLLSEKYGTRGNTGGIRTTYSQGMNWLKTSYGQFTEAVDRAFTQSSTFSASDAGQELERQRQVQRLIDLRIAHNQMREALEFLSSNEPILSACSDAR